MSLSIIIPSRNKKENLPIVLNKLKDVLNDLDYEIIVIKAINDNSDQFVNSSNYDNLRIIEQKKKGYGAALKEGFLSSQKKSLCIFNADGSFETNDIKRLTNEIYKGNDFVYCSRYRKNAGSEDDNFTTFIGNHIFSLIGRLFFKLKLTDILFTYFIANTQKINSLELTSDDFGICVEIPIKMSRENLVYDEIPSYEYKRMYGKKNVNEFRDGFLILIKMLYLFFK